MGRRKKLINNSDIPQHQIEAIARCIMPDILAFYESEEGQREFAEWKKQREAERQEAETKEWQKGRAQPFTRCARPFCVYSAAFFSRGSLGLKVGLRRTLLRKWVVS